MPVTVALWIGSASSRAALAMATTNDREASPERNVAETDLVVAENRVAVTLLWTVKPWVPFSTVASSPLSST